MSDTPSELGFFPVMHSLLAVDALAHLLQMHYSLTNVRCQLIKATIRDTYQVTAAQYTAILSIYHVNQRTAEEIRAEVELLTYLRAHGIIVPVAIRQNSGETLLTLHTQEGRRYAVLFTFIEGQQFSRTPDPTLARDLGQQLAHLHQVVDTLSYSLPRPFIDEQTMLTLPITAFETALQRSQEVVYLRQVANLLQPIFEQLPKHPPYYGLIHGDVSASNTLIMPDHRLALLDFDFAGWGWRIYDIATYLSDLAFFRADPASIQAFLAGYEHIRLLTDLERHALPAFEAARHIFSLGVPALHVNEWGSHSLSDRFVTTLLAHIQDRLTYLR
jgi:Ser/Thr protein kinase RdoA (MazF antagonist)